MNRGLWHIVVRTELNQRCMESVKIGKDLALDANFFDSSTTLPPGLWVWNLMFVVNHPKDECPWKK